MDSSKTIGNFHEVSNFNRLFLKPNRSSPTNRRFSPSPAPIYQRDRFH